MPSDEPVCRHCGEAESHPMHHVDPPECNFPHTFEPLGGGRYDEPEQGTD